MLITVLVAGYSVQGSITVDAASEEDLLAKYPYWYYLPDYQTLVISKLTLSAGSIENSNGVTIRPLDTNVWVETNTFEYFVLYHATIDRSTAITLHYNDVTGWEYQTPFLSKRPGYTSNCISFFGCLYSGERMYTNGTAVPSPFTSAGTSLPSTMPAIDADNVQDIINEALNATTSTTTQAQTIQSNIGSTYADYTSGAITAAEFQAAMDQYQQQLEDLANKSGNTLSDQIAVNNAITYAQTVQINVTQTASSEVAQALNEAITNVTNVFTDYVNGYITESSATTQINQYVTQVTNLMQQSTTAADLEAINVALAALNGYREAIADSGDLDKTVSDAAESSDAVEKAYLDEITAQTTASIEDLGTNIENVITHEEANAVKDNIITPLLDNILIKSLLPIAALFLVISVALGTRYRL